MIELAPHSICTGCMACMASCKSDAISIKKDRLGFAYPVVNDSLCKKCGKCLKTCPALNIAEVTKTDATVCYAAKVRDEVLSEGCSSGGIATACAKRVIEKGGVVYGASFVQGKGVQHIRIDNLDRLDEIKGSKYVESDIAEIYGKIEADLGESILVLFIGTPCQVSAVKRVFESESLLTLSFICGGVPSPSFLKSYIAESNICFGNVTDIIFRKKREYCLEVYVDDNVVLSTDRFSNPYSLAFDKGYSLRPSCLNCDYCTLQRVGDITVGDFWGIEETKYKTRDIPDMSCMMVHSPKGQRLIGELDDLLSEEVWINDIARNNHRLESRRSSEWLQIQKCIFQILYPLFGFSKSVAYTEVLYRIPRKIKRLWRENIRIRK